MYEWNDINDMEDKDVIELINNGSEFSEIARHGKK